MRIVIVERNEQKAKTSKRSPITTPRLRALNSAWNFGGGRKTPGSVSVVADGSDYNEICHKNNYILEENTSKSDDVENKKEEIFFHEEDFSSFGIGF